MSNTQAIGSIKYTRNGGTYFAKLISDYGDIYQKYASYDQNTGTVGTIYPDFAVNPPTIEAYVNSGKGSDGAVYPNSVSWSVDGTELTFNDSGVSTNVFNGESGHFVRINANKTNKTRAGLKIVKNLVKASNATPINISAFASVAVGLGSIKVPASYVISIGQSTSTGNVVRISATNGGILDNEHSSITLTANVESTGGAITSNLKYKWQATDANGDFADFSPAQTGKTLQVSLAMVNGSRLFKVIVDGIGSDVQGVTDETDNYRIVPNPTPITEEIIEGDSDNSQVTYQPKLYKGETQVTDTKGTMFTMKFYNPQGVPIPVATNTLGNSSVAVASQKAIITASELEQNGGANYVISANI